jgi:hypothetical protein
MESDTEVRPNSASTREPVDDATELEWVPLTSEEGSEPENPFYPKIGELTGRPDPRRSSKIMNKTG